MLWPVHLARGLDFYPRSPCGERRYLINTFHRIFGISIHALLAESDLYTLTRCASQRLFLSTLSLRRATHRKKRCCPWRSDFYPRSPCGERRTGKSTTAIFYLFLSTLSLRRATYNAAFYHCRYFISIHALLAESDGDEMESRADFRISIHALLAESDPRWVSASALPKAFLSTLSLRRATSTTATTCVAIANFYPRSPCGERHPASAAAFHAKNFYPRSPCGERRTMNNIHF